MSIFRQAFMQYILAQSGITNLVGTQGVYGYLAPQEAALPFITVTRIGGSTYRNLNGPTGRQEEFWQLSVFAKTDLVCENVVNQLIESLDLYQSTTMSPDGGVSSYTVDNIHLDDGGIGSDIEDEDDDGSEQKIIHKPLTFRILRTQTAT